MLGRDQYQALLDGAQITLQVSALAILWGTVAAVVLGVVSLSPFRPLRWFVRVYVEVLRGVSAIILIFWAYYALPLFGVRSEEHTSELQSLMRTSYAVFCLKKKIPDKFYRLL